MAIRHARNDRDAERLFIITAPAMMGITWPRRRQEMQLYIDLARYRRVPFVWFRLLCQPLERKARLEDPKRNVSKVRNYELLQMSLKNEIDPMVEDVKELLDTHGVRVISCDLDVSNRTSRESSHAMLGVIEECCTNYRDDGRRT